MWRMSWTAPRGGYGTTQRWNAKTAVMELAKSRFQVMGTSNKK